MTLYRHFTKLKYFALHKPTYTNYLFNQYKVLNMIKLTAQDKKLIEKYKKKVHARYPGAFLFSVGSQYYTIAQEQDDLTIKDILAEQLLQPVASPIKAWELAQYSCKITQNLNRTHPLRIEGMKMEDKIARVEARRMKNEIGRESRKFQD